MAKNKNKNTTDNKEKEKKILVLFVFALAGLGIYYVSESMKNAKEIEAAQNGGQGQGGGQGGGIIPPILNPIRPEQNVVCKGDKKPEVRILQNYLKYVKGLFIGNTGVDDNWGANTQRAVDKLYQNKTCFTNGEIAMMRDAYILGGF